MGKPYSLQSFSCKSTYFLLVSLYTWISLRSETSASLLIVFPFREMIVVCVTSRALPKEAESLLRHMDFQGYVPILH
jgi:hypothetical protein